MQALENEINELSFLTIKKGSWLMGCQSVEKILSREMLQQKLEYCHNNPLQAHWNLTTTPEAERSP
ncbi:MAG: hypothetical protein IPH46_04830 [Bacteroidetes bacterium]|nr:hypothetical protein [Bacteroidota bacterium]